ncbi:MAG: pyruvate kinase [Candidatus Moranbacteria bacterium]|nr:pyruvate kinase [Candidatus Moranbacteria bacterium]
MQTKIICTIGPASRYKTTLKKMITKGMRVARINFSHGSHKSNGELLKNIRTVAADLNREIGILTDLQGPRIRVKDLTEDLVIKKGQTIFIYDRQEVEKKGGCNACLGIDSPNLVRFLKKDDLIYIDGGMMELKVTKKDRQGVFCKVIVGGVIKSRKGLNIPKLNPKMEAFTRSDRENLEYMLSQNVDFIAMSFVKSAKDILNLKKHIRKILKTEDPLDIPDVVAKIETIEGVENFDEILKVSDGIMIARGDLAIEIPLEQVPQLQKTMIKKCLDRARPVVVATQMLESMMENPRPTRAEISDVANAVIDHTDCVMLSGESAMGKYPAETVGTMSRIIKYTEAGPYDDVDLVKAETEESVILCFVAKSAIMLAKEMDIKTIVIHKSPLEMARRVSQFRPELKIIYLTKDKRAARKLAPVWGMRIRNKLSQIKGSYVIIKNVNNGEGKIEYYL